MLIFFNGFVQATIMISGLFHCLGRLCMDHSQICLSFRQDSSDLRYDLQGWSTSYFSFLPWPFCFLQAPSNDLFFFLALSSFKSLVWKGNMYQQNWLGWEIEYVHSSDTYENRKYSIRLWLSHPFQHCQYPLLLVLNTFSIFFIGRFFIGRLNRRWWLCFSVTLICWSAIKKMLE